MNIVNVEYNLVQMHGRWAWTIERDGVMVAIAGNVHETELEAANALVELLEGQYKSPDALGALYSRIAELDGGKGKLIQFPDTPPPPPDNVG